MSEAPIEPRHSGGNPDGVRRDLTIIVPLYRGETLLSEMLARVDQALSGTGLDWEMILVNDSDRAEAWTAIERSVAGNPRVRAVDLMRNFGQHAALLCGIREAAGEFIVTMDEDLEQPPEAIPSLLAPLRSGFDVVYGSPARRWQPWNRRIPSQLVRAALKLLGLSIAFRASSFRSFRTSLRNGFRDFRGPFVSVDALLARATRRFTFVEVSSERPLIEGSGYRFGALMVHAMDLITGFSSVPIRFASALGLFFTLFGVGTFFWVISRYLIYGGSVPGFPFLASVISIFSGAQLFALGIIGEYIARIHFRSMNLPPYVIRTRIGDPE